MPPFELRTGRLILRDWRAEDAGDLHRLHCDPLVMATLGPVRDVDYTVNLIADLQDRAKRNGGYTYWAVERQEDGRVLGLCGLDREHEGPMRGMLEIAWRLASDCWGQGYAREAAVAARDWGREQFPSEEIVAITAETNTRSRGLMSRLGMVHRPDLDFDHPNVADGSALKRHVVYSTGMMGNG